MNYQRTAFFFAVIITLLSLGSCSMLQEDVSAGAAAGAAVRVLGLGENPGSASRVESITVQKL